MFVATATSLCLSLIGANILGVLVVASAQAQTQTQSRETIYGSQLMTQQERRTYRNQMRQAKTVQERARERGVTLPAVSPSSGVH